MDSAVLPISYKATPLNALKAQASLSSYIILSSALLLSILTTIGTALTACHTNQSYQAILALSLCTTATVVAVCVSMLYARHIMNQTARPKIETVAMHPQTLTTCIFRSASLATNLICLAGQVRSEALICAFEKKYQKKVIKNIQAASYLLIGSVPAIVGISLRALGSYSQGLYVQGKVCHTPSSVISIGQFNLCGIPAGYCITDGGVVSMKERIDTLIAFILEQRPPILCINEAFDFEQARYICMQLISAEHGYAHAFFNIGPQPVGPCSGMIFATNYLIQDPHFTAFPLWALDGRSKHSHKGVFTITVHCLEQTILLSQTHLGHSEIPQSPTSYEIAARTKQMDIVLSVQDACALTADKFVVGDLNLDQTEFIHAAYQHAFKSPCAWPITWKGDQWCAQLTHKAVSGPKTLDYILARSSNTQLNVSTLRLIDVGYDPLIFSSKALSDHELLIADVEQVSA